MTGYQSKRAAAQAQMNNYGNRMSKYEEKTTSLFARAFLSRLDLETMAIKAALAQPAQEPDALTIAYQSGYHDGKKAALAGREWNFCERCGKRTRDLTTIHTCTPPQEKNNG
jgi:hypothetical protein